jgi:hypothetical protein
VIRPILSSLAAVAAVLAFSTVASAQTSPAASPAPSPSPSAAPNPIGPSLGNNDPCTSLSAIVTRPTVTNSVCTVRPNHVLVETGYLNLTSTTGNGNTVTYPQAAIRIGTKIPALEVDLTPPQVTRTSAGGLTTGSTDVGAGLKYVFGYSPKFSWGGQASFTEPAGSNGFSANGSTQTYALNGSYALTPVFSLATTLASSSLTNGAQHWSSFVPTLVLGAALPNSTGVYAEIATFSNANGPGTATRTQYIYGLYRDVTPRLQLDLSAAVSPTTATGQYHGLGFGISYYF